MGNHITADGRAWDRDTVGPPECWYYRLSDGAVAALARAVRGHGTRPISDLRPDDEVRRALAHELRPVAEALERGPGFAVVEGVPVELITNEQASALYWLVGQILGEPSAQNVQGTMLYDVRDTGQDISQGARFSVTSYESSFHTDNSFGDTILDYVGLLCLKTARSGGLSQVVSGYAVHEALGREAPEALEVLTRPFHVDRRGGVRPGEAPTAEFPVIRREGDELACRYLRYWIQAGHEKAGRPLTPAQTSALDALDEVLARPALRAEFGLKPGDMYFINNRWVLHNRTAFEDHAAPERKRHLVRLWLRRRLTVPRPAGTSGRRPPGGTP